MAWASTEKRMHGTSIEGNLYPSTTSCLPWISTLVPFHCYDELYGLPRCRLHAAGFSIQRAGTSSASDGPPVCRRTFDARNPGVLPRRQISGGHHSRNGGAGILRRDVGGLRMRRHEQRGVRVDYAGVGAV